MKVGVKIGVHRHAVDDAEFSNVFVEEDYGWYPSGSCKQEIARAVEEMSIMRITIEHRGDTIGSHDRAEGRGCCGEVSRSRKALV